MWKHVIQNKSECYANVLHLIKIILVVPVSTAQVERLFSVVKRMLSDWRHSLKADTMEALLRIASEGVSPEEFDSLPVVKQWLASGCRSRWVHVNPYGPHANNATDSLAASNQNDLGSEDVSSESENEFSDVEEI